MKRFPRARKVDECVQAIGIQHQFPVAERQSKIPRLPPDAETRSQDESAQALVRQPLVEVPHVIDLPQHDGRQMSGDFRHSVRWRADRHQSGPGAEPGFGREPGGAGMRRLA